MIEIGSEFWKNNNNYIDKNEELFLSGRTALDVIIKDAIKEYEIKSALLPSFCCHTMIEPFIKNKISVRFYDVLINQSNQICINIIEPIENEMLYVIRYFGSSKIYFGDSSFINSEIGFKYWKATIEDITHSCFCLTKSFKTDYVYGSYRKWFALDGLAIARKSKGKFKITCDWKFNKLYSKYRNTAFFIKNAYIEGQFVEKQYFLKLFAKAEEILSSDYMEYRPNINTIITFFTYLKDIDILRKKRQNNAQLLLTELKKIAFVKTALELSDDVCPLFVPIIVPKNIREPLRKYMIKNNIYCPVHWPLSEYHTGISKQAKKIYNQELSLICDQRYSSTDMKREVDVLKKFFESL